MNLIDRTISFLEDRRNKILNGGINSVPSPFKRFRNDFIGIEQGKYYCITGGTKSAKTQLSSFIFIYNTILYAYHNPDKVRVKIFYFPLEETPEDVLLRFMSYLLYTLSDYKIEISPTDLQSTDNNKVLDENILDLLKSNEYQEILKFFQDSIIFSTSTNPTGVYNECRKYAHENGTVHHKKQKVKDEIEGIKEIDAFDYYEQNDVDEYRIIYYDHISLTNTERGMTLKQSIDKLSEYFVILRNRYKFTIVDVHQQAFAGESLEAYKENKLRPTIGNLADSKYPARDCNVAIGIFSPFKHELREYFGYNIGILRDNIRFIEILVNRGGSPGGLLALYFNGAVNYFKELPLPDTPEIQKVYNSLKIKREKTLLSVLKKNKPLQNKNKKYNFALNFLIKYFNHD